MAREKIILDFNKVYSNKYGGYMILGDLGNISGSHMMRIRFVDQNMFGFYTERIALVSQILTEDIEDYYKPTVFGVACKGNVSTLCNGSACSEYNLWKRMIEICYSNKERYYTVPTLNDEHVLITKPTVCQRWLCYEYFLQDLNFIPNAELWKQYPMVYDLFITILGPDNTKQYSLYTCRFEDAA